VAFLLFAVVAAVTPGPSNIMLTTAGARVGVLRGLPCLLGVTTGMGAMMFVVPLGLGSLVLEHPLVLKALHWGGAAFLLWLSWKIATSGSRIDSAPERDPVGYLGAAIFQWVNPKSWLVTASAAGTFLGAHAGSPITHAGGLPCGPLRPGRLAELLAVAGVRSRRPPRPSQSSPAANLQHRDGRASRALDRPDRPVSRPELPRWLAYVRIPDARG
jgi:hypothetical protein